MTRDRRNSRPFLLSILVHGVILGILSSYWGLQSERFVDFIDVSFLEPPQRPKAQVRKPTVKPMVELITPNRFTVTVERPAPEQRVTSILKSRKPAAAQTDVIKFSNLRVKSGFNSHHDPPKIIDSSQLPPDVITHVNLPTSDAPDSLPFSKPASGASAGTAQFKSIQQQRIHRTIQFATTPPKPEVQSLLSTTLATPDGLDAVVDEMQMGNHVVIPMHPDELGARIAINPQTGMLIGDFQICPVRARHQSREAATEISFFFRYEGIAIKTHLLMKWMSEKTGIKGRIVGRTLYLDDPSILRSPMLYFRADKPVHFTEAEKRNLRRYLVEKGGFIFAQYIHGWGVTRAKGAAQAMRADFREIILGAGGRELMRIPNDHAIWNQPFRLGGQPNITSRAWGERTLPMTAFELDGRIAVVMSYNHDNSSHSKGLTGIEHSQTVMRMCTNFIFYAATHGGISDYTHYIPPARWKEAEMSLPKSAPQAARIGAVE